MSKIVDTIEMLELLKHNNRFLETLLAPLDEEELRQPFYKWASGLIKENKIMIRNTETIKKEAESIGLGISYFNSQGIKTGGIIIKSDIDKEDKKSNS